MVARTQDAGRTQALPDTGQRRRCRWAGKANQAVDDVAELLKQWSTGAEATPTPNQRSAFERFVALCALVFLAGENLPPAVAEIAPDGTAPNMSATEVKQVTDEAVEKLKQSSRTDIAERFSTR